MALTIDSITDDTGTRTGEIAYGGVTNDTTPRLSGTAAAGVIVTISTQNGTTLGTTTADAQGYWNYTPSSPLTDGDYTFVASAQNAGRTETDSFNLTIDTQPDAVPTIATVTDDVGLVQGQLGTGQHSDDTTPTLRGSGATAGDTIRIYDNGQLLGATVVRLDGTWLFTTISTLLEGAHALTVSSIDAAGNESAQSQAFDVIVDVTAPTAMATVRAISDDTGASASDLVTSDNTPTLIATVTGAINADERVQISLDSGRNWQNATLQGADWVIDAATITGTTLADGAYSAISRVIDEAGNPGLASAPVTFTVDTTAPAAVATISAIETDTGMSASDFITRDATLVVAATLTGTLEAGDRVQLSLDAGATWHDATAAGGGVYRYDATGTPLADGTYTFEARVIDVAGNSTVTSQTVVIDTAAPTAGISITGYVDNNGPVQGLITGNFTVTDDPTPQLVGTLSAPLAAGEMVQVFEGTAFLGVANVSGTNWSYDSGLLADGSTHTLKATIVDAAGNTGASASLTMTVDYTITVNNQITIDTTPIVTGSMPFTLDNGIGEYMTVTIAGVTYSSQNGAVVVDPLNGTWYVQVPTALALGVYDVQAKVFSGSGALIVSDDTTSELIIAAPAAPTTLPTAGDPDQKATAVTLTADGQWLIHSNQTMLTSTATNSATVTAFSTTKLVSNTGVGYDYYNYVQNATFIDYNRDGRMDLFTIDSNYDDGQQMFYNNGNGTWSAYQVGARTYAPQSGEFAGDSHTQGSANTWSWYGGIIAIDKNGDGYVDTVNGDQTPNDSGTQGGYASEIVVNNNGTLTGMTKDGSFANNNYAALSIENAKAYGVAQSQPDMELSGVDLNNDGMVDFVMHSQNIVAPQGSVITQNGVATGGSSINDARLVVVSQTAGGWDVTQILNNVFQRGVDTDPYTGNGVAMTWADFNGDGYMDLFMGRGNESTTKSDWAQNNAGEYASRIYFNDGTGKLAFDDAAVGGARDGVGNPTASGMYTFSDNIAGGASLGVDWNHDGKMDIIELPGMYAKTGDSAGITAAAQVGAINLYTNTTNIATGSQASFTTTNLLTQIGQTTIGSDGKKGYNPVTGALAIDLDWDGAKDLMVFTEKGQITYIHNNNAVAEGTALHLRIVDAGGINSFFGNTVQLYDAAGRLVGTQTINPQSGNQTNDSSAIVDFFGLSPTGTYTAVLLRSVNGVSSDVGGLGGTPNGNIVENVNSAWTGLTTGAANHAYVLTAEAGNAANNANTGNGIVGTGYNDTLFATRGTDIYDGGGGTVTISGQESWSNTGGQDIVDYKLAGNTAITVNLSLAAAQNPGLGTATFIHIEGIAGASGNDVFTDNAADNIFNGRGGSDTFNLVNGGRDTLLYERLSTDAVGGNGVDTVNGFTVGTYEATPNADRLDVSALLNGYAADADGPAHYINGVAVIDVGDNIADYLSVTQAGGNTIINIDRDGAGGAYQPTALVTLNGVSATLQTLLANHQIVVSDGDVASAPPTTPGTPGTIDYLYGTNQADTLDGGPDGADVLVGYGGNDLLKVGSGNFQLVDGGSGFDVLQLTGAGINLKLSNVHGVEQINLGAGNTLNVGFQDVLQIPDATPRTLAVQGDGAATVKLSVTDGFAHASGDIQVQNGVTYDVWHAGSGTDVATLLLQQTMNVQQV
jgi:hypothetical protein